MTRQSENKKTVRHFQCRDYLWDVFEQMSAELECSTDYLINEAMRQYARSRNYGTNRSAQQRERSAPPPPPRSAPAPAPGGGIPSLRSGVGRPPLPSPPAPTARKPEAPRYQARSAAPYPPSPAPMRAPSVPPPPPPVRPQQPMGPSRPRVSSPPPLPGSGRGPVAAVQRAYRPPLYVIFNNQRIPVTKDEFVIGRSAKAADLPIKDGNISRRHAAVVFQDGLFYIKDLGSTNGIEFQGRNIDSKSIDEGDIFRLCDYELRFTYR